MQSIPTHTHARPLIFLGLLLVALVALPSLAVAALPADFSTEVVADGLALPTTFDFTPDGRILVAEKGGTVRVVKNGKLLAEPFYELEYINTWLDRGLLGLAVDADFAENGYVYLSYTYENDPTEPEAPKMAQIIRLTADGDVADPDSLTVLVGTEVGDATQPSCNDYATGTDCIPSDSGSHSAGGLRFGPDGYLYATLGDGAGFTAVDPNAYKAQAFDWLNGKMLRLNRDGTAPEDNPFYTGDPTANRSKVYAYGFRNSYRFNFRPSTGALYAGGVGWGAADEINIIEPGGNYGWPCREGFFAQASYQCEAEDAVDPIYVLDHSEASAAIVGGSFAGEAYPSEYHDDYIFADFNRNEIYRMQVNVENEIDSVSTWLEGDAGGPVAVITGPQGNVHFLSIFTGELQRIVYDGAVVNPGPPAARDDVAITVINEPVTIGVLGNDSDPNDDPLFVTAVGSRAAGGEVVRNPNETLTYTPPANYIGEDVFAYVISDGTASDTATVTVSIQPTGDPAAVSAVHESASLSDDEVVVGQQVTFSTTLTNEGAAGPVLVNFELFDQATGEQVMQQFLPREYLEANETRTVSIEWVPEKAGTYRLAVGYISPDWSILHQWVNDAAVIEVFDREPINEPFSLSVSDVTVGTTEPRVNAAQTLTATIANEGRAGSGVVLLEVTDTANAVVHQAVYEDLAFAEGERVTIKSVWTPNATGTHYVDVGAFGAAWDPLYDWAWRAQTLAVAAAASATPPVTGDVVFADALGSTWSNWSWDTTLDLAHTAEVAAGERAIEVAHNGPWAGAFFHREAPLSLQALSTLTLRLHSSATGGQNLIVKFIALDGSEVYEEALPTPSDGWQSVSIDLDGVPAGVDINGVIIMDVSGTVADPYLLDELRFQ